jgi:hypothetical protein
VRPGRRGLDEEAAAAGRHGCRYRRVERDPHLN